VAYITIIAPFMRVCNPFVLFMLLTSNLGLMYLLACFSVDDGSWHLDK
jgi:hypothetical protein